MVKTYGMFEYFYENETDLLCEELKKDMTMKLQAKGINEDNYKMVWRKIIRVIEPFDAILLDYPIDAKGIVVCRVDISPKGSE